MTLGGEVGIILLLHAAIRLDFGGLRFWAAIRFRYSWFGRRPIASLLTGFALSVLLASYLPRGGYLRHRVLRIF